MDQITCCSNILEPKEACFVVSILSWKEQLLLSLYRRTNSVHLVSKSSLLKELINTSAEEKNW